MIVREDIQIKGKDFVKTYSDQNFYIEREEVEYVEAIDPVEFAEDRIYTETDKPIEEVVEPIEVEDDIE